MTSNDVIWRQVRSGHLLKTRSFAISNDDTINVENVDWLLWLPSNKMSDNFDKYERYVSLQIASLFNLKARRLKSEVISQGLKNSVEQLTKQ